MMKLRVVGIAVTVTCLQWPFTRTLRVLVVALEMMCLVIYSHRIHPCLYLAFLDSTPFLGLLHVRGRIIVAVAFVLDLRLGIAVSHRRSKGMFTIDR